MFLFKAVKLGFLPRIRFSATSTGFTTKNPLRPSANLALFAVEISGSQSNEKLQRRFKDKASRDTYPLSGMVLARKIALT